LLTPHEQAAIGPAGCQRIERRLVRAFVEKFRQRFLLRSPYCNWLAIDDTRDLRTRIVQIANQNRFRRTDDYARRLQANVNPVCTEVALFRRVIVRIDEDGVIGTGRHASLATDADRFVEIDYAVGAFEHRRRRTRGYTGRMRALIAACDLVDAPRLRIHAN